MSHKIDAGAEDRQTDTPHHDNNHLRAESRVYDQVNYLLEVALAEVASTWWRVARSLISWLNEFSLSLYQLLASRLW